MGKTMQEAFSCLETVEHVAKVTAIAKSLGNVTPLTQQEIHKLNENRVPKGLNNTEDGFFTKFYLNFIS